MAKSSTEPRRRRSRSQSEEAAWGVWVERSWRFVARPASLGTLLVVAGLLAALSPVTNLPEVPSYDWWTSAFRFADGVRASATLVALATVIGFGMAMERVLLARGEARRSVTLSTVAVVMMGAGIAWGAMGWFSAQANLPTSRVTVPPGKSIQSFPATASGRTFKVMLPQNLTVESVSSEEAKAVIKLSRAGEEKGVRNELFVGDPLSLGAQTVALLGVEFDPRVQAAILTRKGGIEVRASVGEKVRFEPEGPEFEIRRIVSNYVGAMGPAVELLGEEEGSFWVFERDAKSEKPLSDFRLLRLETAPVAVLAFASKRQDLGPAPAGLLFVLGLALFILISDRTPASLSEAGPAREDV